MAFQMRVSKEKIEGKENVLPGQYELKLVGFNPKLSKSGTSTNLNAIMEIVNHPEYAGRKIYDNLNSAGSWTWPDFVHAFGLPMETDGKEDWIPGDWDGDATKFDADKPETWKYKGPLVGRVAKAEIGIDSYGAKIRRYFCAVTDCAAKFPKIKHSEDLMKNSK